MAVTPGAPAPAAPEVVSPPIEVRTEPPPAPPLSGRRLQQALDTPVAGLTWRNVPLRDVLRDAGEAFSVAIVRDRRIDPTRRIDVNATGVPLRNVLAEVAGDADAEVRLVGNAVYLGPADAAAVVRTLAELRRVELERMSDRRLAGRRAELLRGRPLGWGDLSEPAQILRLVSERFDLGVENAEVLPHDLWSGTVLADISAPEALTLLLISFDLTFAWSDDLTSIRLVPLPARSQIVIERSYAIRGSTEAAAGEWRGRLPGLDARPEGGKLIIRGTVEIHDEIERLFLTGGGSRRAAEPKAPDGPPLDRRRFTLAVAGVPATAVMAKLEESGISFEYDADSLRGAGVDLETPVTFDMKQADAKAFFKALFGPVGADFEVAGNTVRLRVSAGAADRPRVPE